MDPISTDQFVTDLFSHILRRVPDPAEKDYWVKQAQSGASDREIFQKFVDSKEHRDLVAVPLAYKPGHFYSPVVDPRKIGDYVRDVSRSDSKMKAGQLAGIQINHDRMIDFWRKNAEFIKATPFSSTPSPKNRYHYCTIFPYGDAIVLRAMIRDCKPRKVIEIGSGYSTACMLDAADHANLASLKLTCIEPYPDRLYSVLRDTDRTNVNVIRRDVQSVPLDMFKGLQENDILFIDSTHVLKTGSDVHYELFEILPLLSKGVVIHFHDIHYPFEYPPDWVFNQNLSWNEIYAVRAFLTFNSEFEIIFFNSLFALKHSALAQGVSPDFLKNPGGSLWLRRIGDA